MACGGEWPPCTPNEPLVTSAPPAAGTSAVGLAEGIRRLVPHCVPLADREELGAGKLSSGSFIQLFHVYQSFGIADASSVFIHYSGARGASSAPHHRSA